MINRLVETKQYLEDPRASMFRPRGAVYYSRARSKDSKCQQFNEVPVDADTFTLDVLEFFFEQRMSPEKLNDPLRELAAKIIWNATERTGVIDLLPRPPGGVPGPLWLVSQAVQIAIRKAQNRCIYNDVRTVIKANFRSEYELSRDMAEMQSDDEVENNFTTSEQGVKFIKQFESYQPRLYNDSAGHCTIGYGTLVHRGNCDGSEADEYRAGIAEARATELLQQELGRVEPVVNSSVTVALNQSQFDALVSFTYNVGTGAFKRSTLLRKLNGGDTAAALVELRKWTKANGTELPGLVRRRAAESDLFISAAYSKASSHYTRIARPFSSGLAVVRDGTVRDTFFSKRGTPSGYHLGTDVFGPEAGDRSISDPGRGLPVYGAINTRISLDALNSAGAYSKKSASVLQGLSIPGTGDASLVEARVALQPWSSTDSGSYGGVVGLSCIYSYDDNSGGTSEFTLYIEFLHLITEKYLPKDKSGRIASFEEWSSLGRGIGFGPDLQNGATLSPEIFAGPTLPLIGYLGATESPHVHLQVGYFNRRTYEKNTTVRVDPMVVLY